MSVIDTPGTNDQVVESATPNQDQAPTPITLTDDSLVQLPGSEKPVKYGEWFRGFQAKHTQATMERSQYQKDLERAKQEAQQYQAELNRIRQAAGGQPPPKRSPFEAIRSRPYVSGEEAADLLEQVTQQHNQTIGQRDQVLRLMVQKLQALDQVVNGLNGNFAEKQFQSKIQDVVKQLGLPDEALELAQEIYLAYDGDNLDQEFPAILKKRWEQVIDLARSIDKRKLDESRQKRFVPGRGPVGAAGKPLDLSRASAKETADALWDSMQSEGT